MGLKKFLCGIVGCIILFDVSFGYVFSDLTEEHWAYNIVNKMHEQGIISGFYDGTFKPEDYVTKEQFATLLFKVLKPSVDEKMSFADVTPDYWSKEYVEVMGQYMEYDEYDGVYYFNPGGFVRRESVAMALKNAMEFDDEADLTLIDTFSDKAQIAESAYESVALCIANGIMKGNADGTFNPKGYLKRAEISALLNNVLTLLESQEEKKDEPISEEEPEDKKDESIPEKEPEDRKDEPISEKELDDKLESNQAGGLNVWNGVYEKSDSVVKLYRVASNRLGVLVINDTRVNFFEMLLNSQEQLFDEVAFLNEVTVKTLTKTRNGVNLQVKSTEITEWETEISGEYSRISNKIDGWDGLYKLGENELILAELGEEMRIQLKGDFGELGEYSDNYNEEKIISDGIAVGVIDSVLIERKDDGIYVTAKKNDYVLDQVSGLYKLAD